MNKPFLNHSFESLTQKVASPDGWRAHRLHALDRDWPETNCELDLWIELAASRGLEPEAMLGFAIAQDFIADQFTLVAPHREELERFYGARINLLALYSHFEQQFESHTAAGGVVLVETDSYYLPDARGVSYRRRHVKSVIAIDAIRPQKRELDYFHSLGFWRLEGEDYDMVVFRPPHLQVDEIIPPYAELVRFDHEPMASGALRAAARGRLAWRLGRLPRRDPIAAFGATLAGRVAALKGEGEHAFHDWAFHTLRQLGANYELLADHLAWLDCPAFTSACDHCKAASAAAKTLQFQLARAVAHGRAPQVEGLLERIASARTAALQEIASRV